MVISQQQRAALEHELQAGRGRGAGGARHDLWRPVAGRWLAGPQGPGVNRVILLPLYPQYSGQYHRLGVPTPGPGR